MIKIAGQTTDADRRRRRKAMAAELIEFAKNCDEHAAQHRNGGPRAAIRVWDGRPIPGLNPVPKQDARGDADAPAIPNCLANPPVLTPCPKFPSFLFSP
ncbi:MAG: hypothetical protein ABII12_17950 [Planctomycetota bacterium]